MESQLQRERQRKMAEEMAAAEERSRMEEMERERVRQEKRAAKERRREEQRLREEDRRKVDEIQQREMQINNRGGNLEGASENDTANGHVNQGGRHAGLGRREGGGGGWCYTLFMFVMGLAVVGVALAISMIWIYTEGKLDSASIQTALPVIQSDVEDYVMTIGHNTVKVYDTMEVTAKPYIDR